MNGNHKVEKPLAELEFGKGIPKKLIQFLRH